jgi:hypothetical protein
LGQQAATLKEVTERINSGQNAVVNDWISKVGFDEEAARRALDDAGGDFTQATVALLASELPCMVEVENATTTLSVLLKVASSNDMFADAHPPTAFTSEQWEALRDALYTGCHGAQSPQHAAGLEIAKALNVIQE